MQHLLQRPADQARIWRLLQNEGAVVYVCGDAKNMAADVSDAIKQLAAQAGGMTAKEADEYVSNLKKIGQYQQDIW